MALYKDIFNNIKDWASNAYDSAWDTTKNVIGGAMKKVGSGIPRLFSDDKLNEFAGAVSAGAATGSLFGPAGGVLGAGLAAIPGLGRAAGYTLARATGGLVGASDNIWDYTMGGIYSLLGKKDKAKALFDDDKAANVRNAVDGMYENGVPEGIQAVGNVAEAIGASLPNLVVGIFGAAAPFVGASSLTMGTLSRILSPAIAGLQMAGRGTREAYNQTGELGGREYGYGTIMGALDAGLNYATDHFIGGKLGDVLEKGKEEAALGFKEYLFSGDRGFADSVGMELIPMAIKAVAGLAGPTITNGLSEALEGGVTTWLRPYIKRITYDKNAEKASGADILISAVTEGGLSSLISNLFMSDFDYRRGSDDIKAGEKAEKEGQTEEIMEEAKNAAEMQGDYPVTQDIRAQYNALSESLRKTGGRVETDEQKERLGILQREAAASRILPLVEQSAALIASYPEAVAEKYKNAGLADANGAPLNITPEDLTEGLDLSGTKEEQTASIRNALKTNKTFAAIAMADAASRMVAKQEAEPYREYLSDIAPEQKASIAAELGVPNDDVFIAQAMQQYAKTDKAQLRLERMREIESMAQASLSFGGMPMVFGSGMQNGAYGYDNGIVIVKGEDGIHLYDKNTGMISKPLTTSELNAALARGRNQNA